MKKRGHSRRLLSVLLALVMLLSLLPTAVFAADPAPKATKITDASELKAGDQIILTATANSKTYAAGSLSSKYLTSIETDPTDPADKVEIFTLGGEAGAWTLTASDGKQIYTNAAKALNNPAAAPAHGPLPLMPMDWPPWPVRIRPAAASCTTSSLPGS